MSVVNSDLNTLLQTVKNMQTAIDSIETTKASISTKYQQLGYGWNDKKYKDLGDVVNACSKSLNTILKTLLQIRYNKFRKLKSRKKETWFAELW